ncbi:electron transport complex protein RnfA [Syntrophus gentianae]|uniref:Electron transport complex protein RnfA n=1 Tax=Syntrophus gentianae TaxID=43775 RepID=A0A1H7VSP7_9BACT|nr:Rnf-Nqr domain containing protein [Syntrophus gentianae]SEM11855.1 electron transport complex protein RnfA [Syntrophus gentianae]
MISFMKRAVQLFLLILVLLIVLPGYSNAENAFLKKSAFKDNRTISIEFAGELDQEWATNPANFKVFEKSNPDVLLPVEKVALSPDKRTVSLNFKDDLNQKEPHVVSTTTVRSQGKDMGTALVDVKKPYIGYLFSILIGAMLINNYVFTKYLGLCVFIGTSKKKDTAIGMGVTFTIVMVISAMISWFLYQFVLKPFRLDFLQVVVFIGLVSLTVQAVDTILRKVNPALFKAFGVYLVLVIANCVILAVPLTLASNEYNAFESFMLALGAGGGFLLALFLMASSRERLELANVPPTFKGLPIAFVTTGLFALAFMGFSGMAIF